MLQRPLLPPPCNPASLSQQPAGDIRTMTSSKMVQSSGFLSLAVVLVSVLHLTAGIAHGQKTPVAPATPSEPKPAEEVEFPKVVQPLLKKYCVRCHNVDTMKSGVRVDHLTGAAEDRHLALWNGILKQVTTESMPPENEPQPTAAERKTLTNWIGRSLMVARSRPTPRNGAVRRLTVSQYRNTLRDLLGLQEDFTEVLPPDGLSKDGFTNHEQSLTLSPLQIEAYFDIAERALDAAIVDEAKRPVIQNFRIELGSKINPQPCPDILILGALSELLNNADFLVQELKPGKPFDYDPLRMRTAYDFIEGYAGNDTVRGWKKFDSIYHSVFACVRGTPGYPKGQAQQVIPSGLLLRPAIPSPEIFGQSNTYGPMANFKISLRELPQEGNFRITVEAARYDDALLLNPGEKIQEATAAPATTADLSTSPDAMLSIDKAGLYQIDVHCAPGDSQGLFSLKLGERDFSGQLHESKSGDVKDAEQVAAFAIARLPAGELKLIAHYGNNSRLKRIVLRRVPDDSEPGKRFLAFEKRSPLLGVHLGLRRDCGSTLAQAGDIQTVSAGELRDYVFEGAIRDFPSPDVEKDNVNYLAGIREIGVRSEYTDGRDMPRLLVRSIEFEGPYFASWPPASHRKIFIESPHRQEPATYASELICSFASRAFRRPVTPTEEKSLLAVWQTSIAKKRTSEQSIKDVLLVVLTSPQFLFLIENSSGPQAEELDPYELASKLSYFLWNTAPDERLLELAAKNKMHESLDAEIERMIRDPRFGQFTQEFASQWLSLDKFDVVAVDAGRYPKLTRDAKTQLRQEPVQFLRHLIERNLPLRNLVQADFVVANEVVASYYNLADRSESGMRFVPIKHENGSLGGVLTQAAILAGLSDGREANPTKRGAWLARKIIAEPPDDPPPNVPQLKEDDVSKLTLRQKLERHRNQEGCAKCHSGIDPWGIPFQKFEAGGLFKPDPMIDSRSTLPDGTEVAELTDLKAYLAEKRIDQVAFSFLKHTASYATGRSLSYNELAFLREEGVKLRTNDYRLQDMLRFVIHSDLFLKK